MNTTYCFNDNSRPLRIKENQQAHIHSQSPETSFRDEGLVTLKFSAKFLDHLQELEERIMMLEEEVAKLKTGKEKVSDPWSVEQITRTFSIHRKTLVSYVKKGVLHPVCKSPLMLDYQEVKALMKAIKPRLYQDL